MSRIADDHYIKANERQQAQDFVEYIVACAANYLERRFGPLPKKLDPIATPSRKRNSPRKWTEHPVHGERFRQLNQKMTEVRAELRRLQTEQKADSSKDFEPAIWDQKYLLSAMHKEYDALRKSIAANERSN